MRTISFVALAHGLSHFFQIAAGFAVDRYGARRVLFLGLFLSTAGAFIAVRTSRHDLVAVCGMAVSAVFMFVIAAAWLPAATLPVLCAATGFSSGLTNPSRDLIVRATTPPGSTGKVYGFVYSGLDVGSMVTPIYFGWLLDGGRPAVVFYTVVVTAILTIATVLNLPGNRETASA